MESVNRRLMLAGAGLAGVAVLSKLAKAGDVNPPAGPITGTMKTTQEIYDRIARGGPAATSEARTCVQTLAGSATAQFVIDQPGCYYLAGNIIGVPNKCCIEIRSSHVELECDGFTFIGVPGTLACIRSAGSATPPIPLRCVGIFDGGFKGWDGRCIDCGDCDDSVVEECIFDSCSSVGADGTSGDMCCVLGRGGLIYDCDCVNTFGGVMSVGENGTIEECAARNVRGISGGLGALTGARGSVIEDNFVMDCDGTGIHVADGAVVLYNRLGRCNDGVELAGSGSVCEDNDIDLSPGAGGHGITVSGQRCCVCCNYITGGGLVVMLGGDGTLIEDNLMVGAGGGGGGSGGGALFIQQGVTRCHVACNRSRGNSIASAMVIPPENSYGPIAVVAAGDISANPAAASPWANFVY